MGVKKKEPLAVLLAENRVSGGRRWMGARRTGNGVVSAIFGSHATVAVAVEARHGFLGEEGEGLFEDCLGARMGN